MKRKYAIQGAWLNRSCSRVTPETPGMNARPINCDLVNASADAAIQRRLFLLWHQKWLHYRHQEKENE